MSAAEAAPQDSLDKFAATQNAASAIPEGSVFMDKREMTQPAPIVFVPDGSFKSLAQKGADIELPGPYDMPGCTHQFRGKQHVAGRTYGNQTRCAYNTAYPELAQQSVLPDEPHKNREVESKSNENSFVDKHFKGVPYLIPGYTGHIPNTRAIYGTTYGKLTKDAQTIAKANRPPTVQKAGMAQTHHEPHVYVLNSNPLPGGPARKTAPKKLIPKHIETLQYY